MFSVSLHLSLSRCVCVSRVLLPLSRRVHACSRSASKKLFSPRLLYPVISSNAAVASPHRPPHHQNPSLRFTFRLIVVGSFLSHHHRPCRNTNRPTHHRHVEEKRQSANGSRKSEQSEAEPPDWKRVQLSIARRVPTRTGRYRVVRKCRRSIILNEKRKNTKEKVFTVYTS